MRIHHRNTSGTFYHPKLGQVNDSAPLTERVPEAQPRAAGGAARGGRGAAPASAAPSPGLRGPAPSLPFPRAPRPQPGHTHFLNILRAGGAGRGGRGRRAGTQSLSAAHTRLRPGRPSLGGRRKRRCIPAERAAPAAARGGACSASSGILCCPSHSCRGVGLVQQPAARCLQARPCFH